MSYFVTGATGFIGRFLLPHLIKRGEPIYVLVRKKSLGRLKKLKVTLNDQELIIPIIGDIAKPNLGIAKSDQTKLKNKITHFFHLAAIYDLKASAEAQEASNVNGTLHAVQLAKIIGADCFHHMSSIAAAGLYKGTFREDMFDEAQDLDDPYFRTKHEAERIVRTECEIPYQIYRPAMVVGHSKTGEMDKIDGPYYLFKVIQKIRKVMPAWMPMVGIEGGRLNIIPVDYLTEAVDYLAHRKGLHGKCFHLTDTKPKKLGELLNIFSKAAHAPEMAMRIDARMFAFIPSIIRKGVVNLPPVKRMIRHVLADLGIPEDALRFINYPTKFDATETEKALKRSKIKLPRIESYAPKIWDYWERNLDPDLFVDKSLKGTIAGKKILITGASSGIGKAAALSLAEAGAHLILVARTYENLEEVKKEIGGKSSKISLYSCDLADMASCEQLIKNVLNDFKTIDYLINNAGRSIRRAVSASYDRFHDYERCMQLNYFGALKLTLGLLPSMEAQRFGHVINISSIGVLTNAPRFSAYVASKSALESFTACAAAEYSDTGVHFTNINMPLVRTPMIAPTKIYQYVPTISPEEAADMIAEAIIHRPKRIATKLGLFARVLHAVSPKLAEIVLNTGFRMFPDSEAAKHSKDGKPQEVSSEQMAFAYLMRGIHW